MASPTYDVPNMLHSRQVSHQDQLGDDSAVLSRRLYFYTAALPKAESYINPHDRFWDYLPLTGALKSDKFSTIWRGSSAAKAGTIMTAIDITKQAKRA